MDEILEELVKEELIKISDEEVKQLPKIGFSGNIMIIDDFKEQNAAAEYLLKHKVIGFDTESRASFKKGVENKIALVQFSAGNRAFLIRLNKVKLSAGIIKLLESPDHIKVGVALKDDIKELQSVTNFEPKCFLDLQKIVNDFGVGELGLKKMSALILGIQISKAQRLSNWEATVLTRSQQVYAATDAWVCVEIFNELDMTPELIKKGETVAGSKNPISAKKKYKKRIKPIIIKEEKI